MPQDAPYSVFYNGRATWTIRQIIQNSSKLDELDRYLQHVRDDLARVYKVTADGKHLRIQDVVDNLVGEHDDVDDHLELLKRLNIA